MPLMQGKSKRAFQHNVAAEVKAGKPMKQSLAIAYGIKRKNAAKKAKGGEVSNEKLDPSHEGKAPAKAAMERVNSMDHKNLAKAILAKKMADGGLVEEMADDDFLSDDMDDLADNDILESPLHMDDDFLSHDDEEEAFPGDHSSNEHGNQDEEKAKQDIMARVMAKVKSRK